MRTNEAAGARRGRCQSAKRPTGAVGVVRKDRLAPALEKRAPATGGGIGVTVAGLSQSRSRVPNGSVRSALPRQSDAIFLRTYERIVLAVPELGASTQLTLRNNKKSGAPRQSDPPCRLRKRQPIVQSGLLFPKFLQVPVSLEYTGSNAASYAHRRSWRWRWHVRACIFYVGRPRSTSPIAGRSKRVSVSPC